MTVLSLQTLYGTPIFTLSGGSARLKEVYGAKYHGKTKEWRFPAFWPVHSLVLSDLRKVVPDLVLSDEVIQYNISLDNYSFPETYVYVTSPFDHQREGLEHLHRYLRAGLFYSPGLGKSKVIVDLQRLTGDTMLILCPKVMLGTWAEEFETHGNSKNTLILAGTKKKRARLIEEAIHDRKDAIITTYKTAHNDLADIFKIPYDCVVLDESHSLKAPFSQRTESATKLGTKAYRRIILSGTPSLGSPFDLYGQLRFLGQYFCSEGWWAFRKKFGVFPKHEMDESVPKMLLGYKNLQIMNDRVNLICKRKTKEECLDLPEQQIIDKYFGVSAAQKKAYNGLILERCDPMGAGIREQIETGQLSFATGTVVAPHVIIDETITLLGKLDQVVSGFIHQTTKNPRLCDGCNHVNDCVEAGYTPYTRNCKIAPKKALPVIQEYKDNARLEEADALFESILEDEANKVIVWARYTHELKQLSVLAGKYNSGFVCVDGSTTPEDLELKKKKFNTDKKCRIYIGQISTGIGLTLNAANYTIYYNLPWSLEHYLQSMDRNYRIGQDRKVTVYRLIAAHTLDEAKAAALDQKIDFSNLVTNSAVCATCPEFKKRCAKYSISLYDEECIYDFSMARSIAEVRTLP